MKYVVNAVLLLSAVVFASQPALACEKHAAEKHVTEKQAAEKLIVAQHVKIGHDHAEQSEERVIHYEIAAPETAQAAIVLLEEKTAEIGAILANASLNDNQMESIHEKTYSLEAAVDKLRASYSNQTALDAADEAIQALHYASENHEQEESRKWYESLKPAVESIKTSFAPSTASSN